MMTKLQARKKRYKLNVKLKDGSITPEERLQLAQLNAFKGKPGRKPRKATPKPTPVSPDHTTYTVRWGPVGSVAGKTFAQASPPTESASPSPDPGVSLPPLDSVAGAAPGIDFSPPDGSAVPGDEPAPEAVTPDAPIIASPAAHALAGQVVRGLSVMAGYMQQLWGFPPLMGLDEVVYPALQIAWANVIEDSGVAGKLGDLAGSRNASRIAVVASSAYLGGGGLYAMFELRKRDAARAAQGDDAQGEPAAPTETAPEQPARPMETPDVEKAPSPIVVKSRVDMVVDPKSGLVQMPVSLRAESLD